VRVVLALHPTIARVGRPRRARHRAALGGGRERLRARTIARAPPPPAVGSSPIISMKHVAAMPTRTPTASARAPRSMPDAGSRLHAQARRPTRRMAVACRRKGRMRGNGKVQPFTGHDACMIYAHRRETAVAASLTTRHNVRRLGRQYPVPVRQSVSPRLTDEPKSPPRAHRLESFASQYARASFGPAARTREAGSPRLRSLGFDGIQPSPRHKSALSRCAFLVSQVRHLNCTSDRKTAGGNTIAHVARDS